MNRKDHYCGSLFGLATCDALGTTLEFKVPGSFQPIDDMVGGGPFGLRPGQWTDDTSMALCLADSLVECNGFDPADQMQRYLRWWREGYQSSTGTCFDIGNTTSTALAHFERTGEPFSGSTDPRAAGNGSIMRLAPVPLFFADSPAEAIERAGESSRTTHGAQEAVDACRYLGGLIVGAIHGCSKEELLSDHFSPVPGVWEAQPLAPKIATIASGSFKHRNPPDIRGTGYVVDSLEAALWAFHRSTSFAEGALLAVNLGDDADTTGAVYGQLAGAFYGCQGIPAGWLEKLTHRELIEMLADGLLKASESVARQPARSAPREEVPPVPFDRSYWVVPGRFLAGFYPGAPTKTEAEQKLSALLDAGIRCVMNLVEEDETGHGGQRLTPYQQLLGKLAAERKAEVTYLRVPIRDLKIPSVVTMQTILDIIDAALARDQATYVHCWGGRGRTGTVVGCYLAQHGLAVGEDALQRIAYLRRKEATAEMESPETEAQRGMVRKWQERK